MSPLTFGLALILADIDGGGPPLESVKALCRGYVEGFVHPATELAYGRRLNGPRGVATLETPANIAAGRVGNVDRPMGYGSGIEDVAYHNGLLLFALCDAYDATGDPYFADLAHQAFRGLRRVAEVGREPGFVARGPHPDGVSYYRDSSLDQHTLYVAGLWRLYRCRLADDTERAEIRRLVAAVIARLERAGWALRVDGGANASWEGGSLLAIDAKWPLVLLMLLAAGADVCDEPRWRDLYETFGAEQDGRRWATLARQVDRDRVRRYTMFHNQHIVRGEVLYRLEPSPERRAILRDRAADVADDMLSCAYLQAWRPLEWLGTNDLDDPAARERATRYLAGLGLNLDSTATIWDLWALRRGASEPAEPTGGNHAEHDTLTLTTPAMAWQCALLSRRPDLAGRARAAVEEMLRQVNFAEVNHGWTYCYAVLAALWSLAPPA